MQLALAGAHLLHRVVQVPGFGDIFKGNNAERGRKLF
jgi:hypothetical protein